MTMCLAMPPHHYVKLYWSENVKKKNREEPQLVLWTRESATVSCAILKPVSLRGTYDLPIKPLKPFVSYGTRTPQSTGKCSGAWFRCISTWDRRETFLSRLWVAIWLNSFDHFPLRSALEPDQAYTLISEQVLFLLTRRTRPRTRKRASFRLARRTRPCTRKRASFRLTRRTRPCTRKRASFRLARRTRPCTRKRASFRLTRRTHPCTRKRASFRLARERARAHGNGPRFVWRGDRARSF